MKSLIDYINENKTRIFIKMNEKDVDGKEITVSAGDHNKFFKGNKNNVSKIVIQLTNKTKTDYEEVRNIKVKSITLVDEYENYPHNMKENEFSDYDTLKLERESDHYLLRLYKYPHNDTGYTIMPLEKMYSNLLSDIFTIQF